MSSVSTIIPHETGAVAAFDAQSRVFDKLYEQDTTIRYKRQRVRQHIEQFLRPGNSLLELNAGTGEDAIYFAGKGYPVHATDIAPGMLEQLRAKLAYAGSSLPITTSLCDFTRLDELRMRGPYDHIFSNFAGLNCTSQLRKVLLSLNDLLKPGGVVTLVILPPFCLWETLLLFRGRWKTAFRRFSGSHMAKIDNNAFRCWYYPPSFVMQCLGNYDLLDLEGLCTLVPPSYLEGVAEKYPRLFTSLQKLENILRRRWPWKLIGDYYIISMRKP